MHEQLKEYALECVPVGSRVTCNPPPTDTDEDWLCYVADIGAFGELAIRIGYIWEGGNNYEIEHFASLRNGNMNLIVTEDRLFFDKFIIATALAKRLNLLNKDDRIALFQGVLYGR